MDIVVLILTVFSVVSVVIVAIIIINLRKRQRESKKKKRRHEKSKRKEEEWKRLEEERRWKEEELCLAEERRHREEEERKRLEEEQRLDEEKKRRDEEERKRLEEERSKKDEERRLVEEKSSKEEEERRRLEEEHRKKNEEQRISPKERGGRPRGSTKQIAIKPSTEPKQRSLTPEIICWNKGWEWIVGIEVPEEFESTRVTQNDELLECDTSDELRCPLKHLKGILKVFLAEGKQDREINVPQVPLIFKMRKDWKGLGRLVRRPTAGYYLAIVPQEWKRDEEMSGFAPVAPENIQIDGYKAHFFALKQNGDTGITFINTKGERIRVESGSSRFQLIGKEISDSSNDMGPLFGEEPPHIKTIDEQEWGNVGVVVVGEEGSGRNRWRTQFVPQEDAKEQRMPDELINRRGGWYFVRIYDKNDNLLESMDFRFIAGLKDIQIMNSECLPEPHGYNDVTVQFDHQAICKVEPADEEMHHALKISRENGLTIVTVPPKPDYDKTHWILCDGNAEIEVTLLVERIWWALGVMRVAPADWTDKTIALSRNDFAATSDKALWVKLPRPRWTRQIEVGFNRAKRSPYQVEVEKEKIAIPLCHFCDNKEIENRQEESRIMIWVQPEGANLAEAVIARIPADQPVSIQKHWNGCGRKKTAIAYAVLRQGSGEFVVNDEPVWMYFKGAPGKAKRFLWRLLELQEVKPFIEKMAVDVKVGSQPSTNRQIKAVTHAVARALGRYDSRLKRLLREKGFGAVKVTTFFPRGKQFSGDRHRNS